VLPAGGLISGQAGLIRLDGWTWEEMAVSRSAAMVLRFPVVSTSIRGEFFEQPRRVAYKDAKKSYDGQLDKLRLLFEDARRYQKAKARGGPDFSVDRRLEALLPVIEGKLPVLVTAARERAIRESLVFAAKQGIRLILAEPREFGATLEEVKSKKIPVILGKTLSLPLDEDDPYDSQYSLPAELQKAGILFAFGTFDSSAVRNLPYQAAAGVAFGLSKDDALKAVTINAAMIWGVDRTLGSVEPGKSADLILTDGDPLETRTQVKMMFIRGRAVSIESKHTRLYQQYLNRP
jgi:imidazolonepropionase-like amidohydrolase